MTVFISWSGPLSKAVADLLFSWLPDVIQGVKTWLSSEDIEKGSIWSEELNEALSTTVGIICVTQENKDARWLLFETGALSKGLSKARVCPLLIDLQSRALQPPLSSFNLTLPEKADMWKLIKTINAVDSDNALDEKRLERSFAKWWEIFDNEFKAIREKHKTEVRPPERSQTELLAEILDNTRAIQRGVERIEAKEKLEFTIPTGLTPGEIYLRSIKASREAQTPNLAKLSKKLSEIAETPTPNLAKFAKQLSEMAAKKKTEKKDKKQGEGGKPPP